MERYIVFFDDLCVLCSRFVQFIHKHDLKNRFRFASLDSEAFRQVMDQVDGADRLNMERKPGRAVGDDHADDREKKKGADLATDPGRGMLPDSVILFMKGKLYLRSSAALHIATRLRFPLPLLGVGWIIPPFLRNGLYDWIARNRYRWFGKRDSCFVPDGKLKNRVLD